METNAPIHLPVHRVMGNPCHERSSMTGGYANICHPDTLPGHPDRIVTAGGHPMRGPRWLPIVIALTWLAGCTDGVAPEPTDASSPESDALFVEVTTQLGLPAEAEPWPDGQYLTPEVTAGGVALLDYDNDGDLDLYQVRHQSPDRGFPALRAPAPNRLYQQQDDGTFLDVSEVAGVGDSGIWPRRRRGGYRQRWRPRSLRDQLRSRCAVSQRGKWLLRRDHPMLLELRLTAGAHRLPSLTTTRTVISICTWLGLPNSIQRGSVRTRTFKVRATKGYRRSTAGRISFPGYPTCCFATTAPAGLPTCRHRRASPTRWADGVSCPPT